MGLGWSETIQAKKTLNELLRRLVPLVQFLEGEIQDSNDDVEKIALISKKSGITDSIAEVRQMIHETR